MAESLRVLVLHGPNLNLLGTREPEHYGSLALEEVDEQLRARAQERAVSVHCEQSNHEGVLIDAIHAARAEGYGAILLNAGGLTHTSVSLRDAVVACGVPVIEIHLSNTAACVEFRHKSLLSAVVVGQITGFGSASYLLGLDAAITITSQNC